MSLFTRRIPLLERLFPSSGREVAGPLEVTDVVHLMHPWPGRTLGLLTCEQQQIVGASALTPTVSILEASAEEWIEVLYGDISHNSATSRNLQLAIFNLVVSRNTFIGRWRNQTDVWTANAPGGFQPLFNMSAPGPLNEGLWLSPPRPLVIPPRYRLDLLGDTAGVAYALTAAVVFVRHLLHDPPTGF